MEPAVLKQQVREFVAEEQLLLDRRAYLDWLELWGEEGEYWVPRNVDAEDPSGNLSLVYDDIGRLRIRVERLTGKSALLSATSSRTSRVCGDPIVREVDEGIEAESSFVLTEFVGGKQRLWAGHIRYILAANGGGGFTMHRKRVSLINSDGILPPIGFLF